VEDSGAAKARVGCESQSLFGALDRSGACAGSIAVRGNHVTPLEINATRAPRGGRGRTNKGSEMQKSGAWGCARRSGLIVLAMTTMIAAGCGGGGGGGGGGGASASSSGAGAGATNKAPTISGSPVEQAQVGASYTLKPQAQDADGDTLAFSIQNKPEWAVFNTATGELSGLPAAQHVGVVRDVTISVSDGRDSVALGPFSITVSGGTTVSVDGASVALSWDVPTTTIDGQTLPDLAGYRIHYGFKANAMTEAVELPSAGLNKYVVQGLKKGKYYFAVRAIMVDGAQSDTSNVVSKVIG
jgi:hypothetical protein